METTMSLKTFMTERPRATSQSTVKSRGRLSMGSPTVASTNDNETKPASGTPAMPMAAAIQQSAAIVCWPNDKAMPCACATKSTAIPS